MATNKSDTMDVWDSAVGSDEVDPETFGSNPISFQGVDESKAVMPVFDKGIYPGRVRKCEFAVSQQSSKPMLKFTCRFTNDGGEETTVYHYAMLAGDESQLARTKVFLFALAPEGIPEPFIPDEHASFFEGIEFSALLRKERASGDNRASNKISKVVSSEGASNF